MDISKFKISDWLKVGGGLGFLIFGSFLKWAKLSIAGFSVSGSTAWDYFFTGIVPMLLIVGAAVVTVLLVLGTLKPGQLPWPLITLAATGIGALLVVLRLLVGPGDGLSRGPGLILSALAAVVAAAGGFLGFRESGGDIKDLTDVNKLKSAFNHGAGGATPPPPPGGSVPPPPPPPA